MVEEQHLDRLKNLGTYAVITRLDAKGPGTHWQLRCKECGAVREATTSALNANRVHCPCQRALRPRKPRSNPRLHGRGKAMLTIAGVTKSLREWVQSLGLSETTVRWRLAQREQGRYLTDEEVLYGRRLTVDAAARVTSVGMLIERMLILLMPEVERSVRAVLERVAAPHLQAALAGRTDDAGYNPVDAMTDPERRAAEDSTPPHPRDNEVLPHLMGMTLREFRLSQAGLPAEWLAQVTAEVLDVHDHPDRYPQPDSPAAGTPEVGTTPALEVFDDTDALSEEQASYYTACPWWSGVTVQAPPHPCMDARMRAEWLAQGKFANVLWTHLRADTMIVSHIDLNEAIDLQLMRSWLAKNRFNTEGVRAALSMVQSRLDRHPEQVSFIVPLLEPEVAEQLQLPEAEPA